MQVRLLPEQGRLLYRILKILGNVQPILELKFVVPDKKTANYIYKQWEDKAAELYSVVSETLVD